MSTLRVNTIQNSGGTGSPAINGLAAAWVNFNGTGTVAIRGSSNVSSITDLGTGDYRVNFTTAMPDVNYSFVLNKQNSVTNQDSAGFEVIGDRTTTSARVVSYEQNASTDTNNVSVAIFR
jgi:hypothetical protein